MSEFISQPPSDEDVAKMLEILREELAKAMDIPSECFTVTLKPSNPDEASFAA